MTMVRRIVLAAAAALGFAVLAVPAGAQPAARGSQSGRGGGPPMSQEERAQLERRFRERLGQVVQRELRLSSDQAQRLETVTRSYEGRLMPLMRRERDLRRQLREELMTGEAASDQRVDGILTELMRLQRQRLELVESEQAALAQFLTPVQRARYFALQEIMRHRMDEQRGRSGPPGGATAQPSPRPPRP